MENSKLKSKKAIIGLVKNLKAQGKKVVVFSGSFDVLHIGHINAIQVAKKQGDVLIILLNSDHSVRLYKGSNHPLTSEQERAKTLAALEAVDYVSMFDELTPENILSQIKPDIYCNGSDWGKNCIERDVVEKNGGKVYVLPWEKGYSTSALMKKLSQSSPAPDAYAVFLDRDGTINVPREGGVRTIEHFVFLPGVVNALKKLSKTDYKIIVITNQSGIGRKVMTENDLKKIHNWMVEQLKKEGVRIDAIYYCSHHPDNGCICRKPNPGMFLKAGKDFNINLSKSWMIGDDQKDVVAARRANIKAIKIGKTMPRALKIDANYYAKNILEAVSIIIRNTR